MDGSALAVTISHTSAPVVAWGADFDLMPDSLNAFSFNVDVGGVLRAIEIDFDNSNSPADTHFIGIEETDTFSSFSVSHTYDYGLGPIEAAPTLTRVVFRVQQGGGGGQVPEPTTLAIWSLLGLIGLAVVRRRRRV